MSATHLNVSKSRFGLHPCSYSEYIEIRTLWRTVQGRRALAAHWWRWARKRPESRIRTSRWADQKVQIPEPTAVYTVIGFAPGVVRTDGRYVGYDLTGPDTFRNPAPRNPQSTSPLCRLQEAHYLARHPVAVEADLKPLPVSMAEVRLWLSQVREPQPAA